MWVAIITLIFSQNLFNYCREETTTPQNEKCWYILEFMIHQLLKYSKVYTMLLHWNQGEQI
jgi:hypothetical protein